MMPLTCVAACSLSLYHSGCQVLARLEGDHGFDIVRDATCLLLCARRGITDSELVALLQTSRQRWTVRLHVKSVGFGVDVSANG